MVKYEGKVIHSLPVGRYEISENWNNSMCQYYPTIMVFRIENDQVKMDSYSAGEGRRSNDIEACLEVVLDPSQVALFAAKDEARREELRIEEFKRLSVGKEVKVFKGRKYPIGTLGRVFWVGDNQWGTSAGLECADGKKFFISANNIEVIGTDWESNRA